jgi:hypothetical protein
LIRKLSLGHFAATANISTVAVLVVMAFQLVLKAIASIVIRLRALRLIKIRHAEDFSHVASVGRMLIMETTRRTYSARLETFTVMAR